MSKMVSVRFRRRFTGGVVVWLNAERGPTMLDLSGRGNHPTLNVAPSLAAGGPGGKRVWTFGGTHYITLANVLSALTVAECFLVVKRADNANGNDGLWVMGSSGQARYPFPADGGIYDDWGSTVRKTTGVPVKSPVTDYIVYNVVTKANEWTSRINGTQHFTTATNTVAFPASCELGRNAGGQVFTGTVADLMVINRELSAGERASVTADLIEEFRIV